MKKEKKIKKLIHDVKWINIAEENGFITEREKKELIGDIRESIGLPRVPEKRCFCDHSNNGKNQKICKGY